MYSLKNSQDQNNGSGLNLKKHFKNLDFQKYQNDLDIDLSQFYEHEQDLIQHVLKLLDENKPLYNNFIRIKEN